MANHKDSGRFSRRELGILIVITGDKWNDCSVPPVQRSRDEIFKRLDSRSVVVADSHCALQIPKVL